MKLLRRHRVPAQMALGFCVLGLALAACTGGPEHVGAEYGVVADPPLPVDAPVIAFDPASSIANVDGSTIVDFVDGNVRFAGADGALLASFAIDDDAELRAVSADGTRGALLTMGSASSTITVVERTSGDVVDFELLGRVEPEAFSTDGTVLYVIDHQISIVPGAYRVRPLNLETGQLETILGPTKVPLVEDMNGTARRQVWSPDGSRLNTLYIRQTHHHHDDGSEHAHGEPGTDGFVHILDLNEEWAYCLDLPPAFGGGDLATSALAVSADGSTLAIADVNAQEIAFASADHLEVTRTVPLPEFTVGEDLQIGMTGDAVIFGSGRTVQWFDAATMHPLADAETLGADVVAFTSSGDSVWAWTANITSGPRQLTPPKSPART